MLGLLSLFPMEMGKVKVKSESLTPSLSKQKSFKLRRIIGIRNCEVAAELSCLIQARAEISLVPSGALTAPSAP